MLCCKLICCKCKLPCSQDEWLDTGKEEAVGRLTWLSDRDAVVLSAADAAQVLGVHSSHLFRKLYVVAEMAL